MAMIVSVVNQKGGVGKTTTAVNLAAYLAHHGKFVLLVDLDPQANASSGLGVTAEAGVYEAMMGVRSSKELVVNTAHEGLRMIPSTINLAGAPVELVGLDRREWKLHEALLEVRNDYDYILIDNPPSLGLLTINGLVASDALLIPVQAEYYALEGLSQLMQTVQLVRDGIKPEIDVMGAVITMYDPRTTLSRDVLEELYKHFPNRIFRSVIPRNVRLAEAPSAGKSILHYDPSSKGAKAYERLAREFLLREQESTP
ncbi:TPA: chromosome partitioning protein ParA [Candidatus Uhrbacteria bacterium]|nr:MAG: chromosome partitioning protein ParA [Candidatus Uhrbacteria bacterium RIFCSPHIGHO2_02_FULL_54_11]HBL39073.1 chromosome partitioning protein ParA [Candidatus Uhrbacteria bacterium]